MSVRAVCQACEWEGLEEDAVDHRYCPHCGDDEVYFFEPASSGPAPATTHPPVLIGTVRREDHNDGGHSVWMYGKTAHYEPRWWCIYSTAAGNVGERWPSLRDVSGFPQDYTERFSIENHTQVIGVVPGTPAGDGAS